MTMSPSRPCIGILPSLNTAHLTPLARSRIPMNFNGIGGGGGGPGGTTGFGGPLSTTGGVVVVGRGGGGGGAFG